MPGGRPVEQDVGPSGCGGEGRGQDEAGDEPVTPAPQTGAADADHGPDRGSECDRVIRVDDPLGEAQGEARDDEPAAPQHQRRSGPVRAGGSPAERERADSEDQRGRNEPGDLPTHLGVEHPGQAGCPPATATGAAHPADAAGLVAVEPPEAVVTEDQIEDAVVLGAADVGPRARRQEFHGRDPPAGSKDHRSAGE